MHIPDGIVPVPVCAAGYAVSALATGLSLIKIKRKDVPKISLLTAAFFVATWIHIPIPPTSVHLILNGLLGVILGPGAFIAILIGLFFQAILFQHGGLTTLGLNAVIMGLPAILSYFIFRIKDIINKDNKILLSLFGFISGGLAVGISAVLALAVLIFTLPSNIDKQMEINSLIVLTIAYIPIILIEGVITVFVLLFLKKIKPELIE